jgi:hypothetical protein
LTGFKKMDDPKSILFISFDWFKFNIASLLIYW